MTSTKCVLTISLAGIGLMHAQAPAANTAVFTAAQAAQGKAAYAQNCAGCHGPNFDDGAFGPPVSGAAFRRTWGGQTADNLFTYLKTKMPPGNAGSLSDGVYAQILAALLQANGAQPGNRELPSDVTALKAMMFAATPPQAAPPAGPPAAPAKPAARRSAGGPLSPYATLPPPPVKANPLDKITPVTEAMLRNPPAGEWLTWRRTWDGQGFSPLNQINRNNVNNLQLIWSWSLPSGANESTPLVHDGVIFVHSFGDNVQALDAATGDLLWHYSRQLPAGAAPSVKRNIAIYGDRLLVATSDVHMISLDVKTGKVMWDREIAERIPSRRLTGGPLVAKGKVMAGTTGNTPGGNLLVALDIQTGQEAWRFNTIAQPGEPGGDSWNGLPVEKRNGASIWTAGSYDPALNLVFFGPAQTYDTGPLMDSVKKPGFTNDGLYTDTTLAINPDTGKLVWHFQHTPNDQWDLDWAFERQLIRLPVNGVMRTLVLTSGKEAYYDAVDAETGKFAFSIDMGLQNVILGSDPVTGAKTINPKVIPGKGETVTVCPHAGGAKSWLPGSYNPDTKILFVPLVESCMDLIPVAPGGRGNLSSGVNFTIRPRLDTDGKFGRLAAVNLETKKPVWTERLHSPISSGALDTAGGVVFNGWLDRRLTAYDDSNGKLLWEARLNDVPSSVPMTYSVNGKQYLAVVVGNGGAHAITWPTLVPEIQNPPGGGAAIWVFALPDRAR